MSVQEKFKDQINEMQKEQQRCIDIAGRKVGDGFPVFVIAEAGNNHMCDMGLAKEMVDKACEAGADAIKFQTYKAAKLVRKEATSYWEGKEISQLEYYSRLDKFGADEYRELFQYAHEKGIIPFSTPFDMDSASMLDELGAPLFKMASCDLPDLRLIKHVAGFGKPVILSLGGSTLEEIDRTIEAFYETGNMQLILLACTLSYPTKNEDANLLRIRSLQEKYPWMIIGLSDHTEPDNHMVIPSLAVALGAKVIEKHYTLDRSMTGSGHFFSVNPVDLKYMIENIRLAECVLGSADLGVLDAEKAARENARRSIVAEVAITAGTIITEDMLGMKRPADGLPGFMMDQVVGKCAKQDISADQALTMEMLQAP